MKQLREVKLICMDMDGTLFAGREQIPEINVLALRRCAEKGIHTALVSGRNYRFLMDHARRIGTDMAIVSANGARIDEKPDGRCIFEAVYTPAFATLVSQTLWDLDVNYEVYTKNGNYSFRSDRVTEKHRASLERYLKNGQVSGLSLRDTPQTADIQGIYKFVAFTDDKALIARIREALDSKRIVHSSSWADNVEIMPEGVGKGRALKLLAGYFGVPLEDTLAFGDYTNDIDMLKSAGHAAAMENGVDELKRFAEIVAPNNMSGGVGRVIFEKVLCEPLPAYTA